MADDDFIDGGSSAILTKYHGCRTFDCGVWEKNLSTGVSSRFDKNQEIRGECGGNGGEGENRGSISGNKYLYGEYLHS